MTNEVARVMPANFCKLLTRGFVEVDVQMVAGLLR
jgi:hypothetical protein